MKNWNCCKEIEKNFSYINKIFSRQMDSEIRELKVVLRGRGGVRIDCGVQRGGFRCYRYISFLGL